MTSEQGTQASVRSDEIARFDALAAQWWDPTGPMRPLHEMNPLRTAWINHRIPPGSRILDIGCGAGLATEALAREGHTVLGLDAAPDAVKAAQSHAQNSGVTVQYRTGAAEDLVREGARYPVITALEIIEHVTDPAAFLNLLATLLEPGGQLFISTLNRTPASLLIAKLGAEYIARLLPIGTHAWDRFITPAELARHARAAHLRLVETAGMRYAPTTRQWITNRDLSINYIAALTLAPHNPAATPS